MKVVGFVHIIKICQLNISLLNFIGRLIFYIYIYF